MEDDPRYFDVTAMLLREGCQLKFYKKSVQRRLVPHHYAYLDARNFSTYASIHPDDEDINKAVKAYGCNIDIIRFVGDEEHIKVKVHVGYLERFCKYHDLREISGQQGLEKTLEGSPKILSGNFILKSPKQVLSTIEIIKDLSYVSLKATTKHHRDRIMVLASIMQHDLDITQLCAATS